MSTEHRRQAKEQNSYRPLCHDMNKENQAGETDATRRGGARCESGRGRVGGRPPGHETARQEKRQRTARHRHSRLAGRWFCTWTRPSSRRPSRPAARRPRRRRAPFPVHGACADAPAGQRPSISRPPGYNWHAAARPSGASGAAALATQSPALHPSRGRSRCMRPVRPWLALPLRCARPAQPPRLMCERTMRQRPEPGPGLVPALALLQTASCMCPLDLPSTARRLSPGALHRLLCLPC